MSCSESSWVIGACGAALALFVSLGCAGANQAAADASRLSFSELDGSEREQAFQKLTALPAVLEFKAGDRVPVTFLLDSELLELEPVAFNLVAKRTFYLLLRSDGPPLLSADGVDFEQRRKNSFFVGFDVRKGRATRLRLGVGLWPEAKMKP